MGLSRTLYSPLISLLLWRKELWAILSLEGMSTWWYCADSTLRRINRRSIAWETTPLGAPAALFPGSNLIVFPMASPLEGSWRAGWLCSPGKEEMCCPYVYGEWYAHVWPWGCACVWGCVCTCICMGSMCTYRYICVCDGCIGGVCLLQKNVIHVTRDLIKYQAPFPSSAPPAVLDSLLLVIAVCPHENQEKEELAAA